MCSHGKAHCVQDKLMMTDGALPVLKFEMDIAT